METQITLKGLEKILRGNLDDDGILLNEQNTGYSISTCYAFDNDGRNLGRILTAYSESDDDFIVSVNGKVRIFKTLGAIEKALDSIGVESFHVSLV